MESVLERSKYSACHDVSTQDCPNNDSHEGGIVVCYASEEESKFT